MTISFRTILLAAGLATPVLAQEMDHSAMDHSAMGHGAAASDDPVVQQWIEINDRMHMGMAIEFSGDPDIDFVRGMIAHHQGAVEMAKVLLEHGSDPELLALAEEIVAAQEAEIAFMEAWLADNEGHAGH